MVLDVTVSFRPYLSLFLAISSSISSSSLSPTWLSEGSFNYTSGYIYFLLKNLDDQISSDFMKISMLCKTFYIAPCLPSCLICCHPLNLPNTPLSLVSVSSCIYVAFSVIDASSSLHSSHPVTSTNIYLSGKCKLKLEYGAPGWLSCLMFDS